MINFKYLVIVIQIKPVVVVVVVGLRICYTPIKTLKMAVNRLGNHTGKTKRTT